MMSSLFSVFDPVSYFGLSLNWIIMIMIMMFIPLEYYFVGGGYSNVFMVVFYLVSGMFNEVAAPNYMVLSFLGVVTFLYLIISNLMGLFPFIFTSTAHLKVTLGVGVILWLSFFLMGWLKSFSVSAAHLVPEGAPLELAPILVVIESVSHLIRPFTLSIRLAANMVAGHLIVGLLSSISLINFYGFFTSMFLQSILLVLEFGVAVIQGFVFSVLLLLYALDYY